MNPTAAVKMYSTRFCPYCMRARSRLAQKGGDFQDIAGDGDHALRAQMMADSGRQTVPQIWNGETHVGGFDELWLLEQQGKLDQLLKPATTQV